MNGRRKGRGFLGWTLAGMLTCGMPGLAGAQTGEAPELLRPLGDPPAPGAPQGYEVMTRGPVHEAFAEPVVFDPTPGIVIAQGPPPAVEELPPDQKPEGEDVAWVPGYWAWDDAREDFLWISGIWRKLPPDRQWIPGYWTTAEGGHRWVSGYWAPLGQEQVEYLPEPPRTLESGPNVDAPAEDYTWSPGHWTWHQERYVWSPGVWVPTYPEWIWTPPTYYYTPAGYVFVPGYWDYVVAERGMLFAPIYFAEPLYARPAFVYTPTVTINVVVLTEHFFCRPQSNHYFFGDYYGHSGAAGPYQPWFAFHEAGHGYDPIYAWSENVYGRRDATWVTAVREAYYERVAYEEYRPPVTFAAQQGFLARHEEAGIGGFALARSLSQVQAIEEYRDFRLERIDETRRLEFGRRQEVVDQYRDRRAAMEVAAPIRANRAQAVATSRRMDMPRSPLAATMPARFVRPRADGLAPGVGVDPREHRRLALDQLAARRQQRDAEAGARLDQQRAAQAAEFRQRQGQRAAQAAELQRRQEGQTGPAQQARQALAERQQAQQAEARARLEQLRAARGSQAQPRPGQQAQQQRAAQVAEFQQRQGQQAAQEQQALPGLAERRQAQEAEARARLEQQRATQARTDQAGPAPGAPTAANRPDGRRDDLLQALEQRRQRAQQQQAQQQVQQETVRQQQAEAARQQQGQAQQAEVARRQQAAQAQQQGAARQQAEAARQQQAAAARQQQVETMRRQQAPRQQIPQPQRAEAARQQGQQARQAEAARQRQGQAQQAEVARRQQAAQAQQQGAARQQAEVARQQQGAAARQQANPEAARRQQAQQELQRRRQQRGGRPS